MAFRMKIKGFTLIELMIVVAILGVLALIAVPKFANLVRKSNEAATRGHMGSMRSALSIYYAGTEGLFPADLVPLTTPGGAYSLKAPPMIYTAEHGTSMQIDYYVTQDSLSDSGRWGYVSTNGVFWVPCLHRDVTGRIWSEQ